MNKKDKEKCDTVNFYKFFNPASLFNINFKNCLTVVGRYIDNLILDAYEEVKSWATKVIDMILRVRQKIRPERHYVRRSYQLAKK
jgi:hypothetical protein